MKSAKDLFEDSQSSEDSDDVIIEEKDANVSDIASKQPNEKDPTQKEAVFVIDETRLEDDEDDETTPDDEGDELSKASVDIDNEDLAKCKRLSDQTAKSSSHDSSSTNICDRTLDIADIEQDQGNRIIEIQIPKSTQIQCLISF